MWAATLSWLTWRTYGPNPIGFAATRGPLLSPDAFFYSVHAGPRQVGIASLTVDTVSDGYRLVERIGLDLPIQPTSPRSQYLREFTLDSALGLVSFRIARDLTGGTETLTGIRVGDSLLVVTSESSHGRYTWRVPVHNPMPAIAGPMRLARESRLRRGTHLRYTYFDPLAVRLRSRDLAVTAESSFVVSDSAVYDSAAARWFAVHADTLRAWRVDQVDGGANAFVWVDGRGLPLRGGAPGGLTLDRAAFEIVNLNYQRRLRGRQAPDPLWIVPRTAPASGVPFTGSGPDSMLVRLIGAAPVARIGPVIAGPFQELRGDTLALHVARLDSLTPGFTLPARDSSRRQWLEDEPLLGLGSPEVDSLSRAILAGETDPVRATVLLTRWVARSIQPAAVAGVVAAPRVLAQRRGGVNEHTLAFVALARAAGLPAREVSGALFARGRFYLHSWAEVYLGEWVPVDPSAGQAPADAGHLRFATAEPADPLELLTLIGGLRFEPLHPTSR